MGGGRWGGGRLSEGLGGVGWGWWWGLLSSGGGVTERWGLLVHGGVEKGLRFRFVRCGEELMCVDRWLGLAVKGGNGVDVVAFLLLAKRA